MTPEEEIATLKEQNEVLALQAKAGNSDPSTDVGHPGNLLLLLGWRYNHGDPYACDWTDPELVKGARLTHALPSALGVALRRMMRVTMSTSISSLQEMLARAGAKVPHKKLNTLKPHELSIAEKWAIETNQPGTFPEAKMPSWLRAYTTKT
jgi:hypothetical protein